MLSQVGDNKYVLKIPDYSRKKLLFQSVYHSVSYSGVGIPYKVPEDGWFEITNHAYSNGYGGRSVITLDGTEIASAFSGESSVYDEANLTSVYPVAKGQQLNVTQYGCGYTIIYYIPFKK